MSNKLISIIQIWELPLVMHNGHLFLQWNIKEILFAKHELYRLPYTVLRNIFHPSSTRLFHVLKRGYPEKWDSRRSETITNYLRWMYTLSTKINTKKGQGVSTRSQTDDFQIWHIQFLSQIYPEMKCKSSEYSTIQFLEGKTRWKYHSKLQTHKTQKISPNTSIWFSQQNHTFWR